MRRPLQGQYVTISTVGEHAHAFVPAPLPPVPPVEWSTRLRSLFDQALLALGRLDAVSMLLPDTALFIYMYVRKEAVLSSMIEGTQSSLSDLLLFELDAAPGVPLEDVREVSQYVAAFEHGLHLLAEGLPLSLRLLREVHGVLLGKGRGSRLTPGEFRKTQNWIGGTRPGNAAFVPPPAQDVLNCMSALERFLNDVPEPTPVLLKAALAHVQFETIHPFLDGNGRVGRLLITLLLCQEKVLSSPMLYLSLYFKTHRRHYYELLNAVRSHGDWESWLEFFAEAVIASATQGVETAQQLAQLCDRDRDRISTLGRAAASALQVHRLLLQQPLVSSNWLVERSGRSAATINKALASLEQLGLLREVTSGRRNRLFCYHEYVDILNRGAELPT